MIPFLSNVMRLGKSEKSVRPARDSRRSSRSIVEPLEGRQLYSVSMYSAGALLPAVQVAPVATVSGGGASAADAGDEPYCGTVPFHFPIPRGGLTQGILIGL